MQRLYVDIGEANSDATFNGDIFLCLDRITRSVIEYIVGIVREQIFHSRPMEPSLVHWIIGSN